MQFSPKFHSEKATLGRRGFVGALLAAAVATPKLLSAATSAATAPDVHEIELMNWDDDGYKWRSVRSELEMDSGRLLLELEQLREPQQDHFILTLLTDSSVADTAINVTLTAAELDWTIQQLGALRDRARAEGLLGGAR